MRMIVPEVLSDEHSHKLSVDESEVRRGVHRSDVVPAFFGVGRDVAETFIRANVVSHLLRDFRVISAHLMPESAGAGVDHEDELSRK